MSGRIRSLKPEWVEDEPLQECGSLARLLSVGLIVLADDHGRGRANEIQLAAKFFHLEPDPGACVRESLARLSRIGFVVLYRVRGQSYYQIRNWSKHQRVDKPGKPRFPGLDEADAAAPEPASSPAPQNPPEVPANPPETLAKISVLIEGSTEHRSDGPSAAKPAAPPAGPSDEDRIAELSRPYPADLIGAARDACRRARSTGRMQASVWAGVLDKLAAFSPEIVVGALRIFVDKYGDGTKDETYLLGIVRGERDRRPSLLSLARPAPGRGAMRPPVTNDQLPDGQDTFEGATG